MNTELRKCWRAYKKAEPHLPTIGFKAFCEAIDSDGLCAFAWRIWQAAKRDAAKKARGEK